MIVDLEIKDHENKITKISNCELVYMSKFFSCKYSNANGEESGWFEVTCEINLEENGKLKIFKFLTKHFYIEILSEFEIIKIRNAYISEMQGNTIEIKGRAYNY